ncbi:MAG: hypothetical protein ACOYJD_02225, partial [Christensenellales bacterium]
EKVVAFGSGVIAGVGMFLLSELADGWSVDDFSMAVLAGLLAGLINGMFAASPKSAFAATGIGVVMSTAGRYAVTVTNGYSIWDSGRSAYITLALCFAVSAAVSYIAMLVHIRRSGRRQRAAKGGRAMG